ASGMTMPGGWTMSMAWMRMPGQTWLSMAVMFMGMWVTMMGAMMLPSLVPMLSTYRCSLRRSGEYRASGLTALVGTGYFLVWAVLGAVVYPLGTLLMTAEMRWPDLARSAPWAAGVTVLIAGCFQLTAWKAHLLCRCRNTAVCGQPVSGDAHSAWCHGIRLGTDCALCCSGFTTILLATGVMNLGTMTLLAAAITIERLAPRPECVALAAGVVILAAATVILFLNST